MFVFFLLWFGGFASQTVLNDIAKKIREGGVYPKCVAPVLPHNGNANGTNCGEMFAVWRDRYNVTCSIRLINNGMKELPASFTSLVNLRLLYVEKNPISALPKGFSALTSLTVLFVSPFV